MRRLRRLRRRHRRRNAQLSLFDGRRRRRALRQPLDLRRDIVKFVAQPRRRAPPVFDPPLKFGALRLRFRKLRRRFVALPLRLAHRLFGLAQRFSRDSRRFRLTGCMRVEFGAFDLKRAHHAARVVHARRLARLVFDDLRQPCVQPLSRRFRARFFAVQRHALGRQPLQRRAALRRRLPQHRQFLVRFQHGIRRLRSLQRQLFDLQPNPRQFLFSRRRRHRRRLPAHIKRQRVRALNMTGEIAISRRLPRLPLQVRKLLLDFLNNVRDARQIGRRRIQLQFGFMPPRMQTRNAGRFFKNRTPRNRLRVDQRADLPLPHQRRRMRARRNIGKEQLHVARTYVAPVDLVDRAHLALDPPRNLDRLVVIVLRRNRARRVVDDQRHLGRVAAGALIRAGKDHVVHA